MVDDLKKKLVQYGDKVLFGVFVLVLGVTVAVTMVGGKSKPGTEPRPLGKRPETGALLVEDIAKLAEKLDRGEVPDGYITGGFATDPDEIAPRRGEKQCKGCGYIVPENVKRCPKPPGCGRWFENDDDNDGMPNDWEDRYKGPDRYTPDANKDPDGDGFTNLKEYLGGSDPDDPKSIPSPFRLTDRYRKRIDIQFYGYIVKEGGDPDVIDHDYWVIQINWGRNTRMTMVPLGAHFHGYRLFPLEKTKVLRKGRGGIPDWYEDVYVLTIQKRGQSPIKLEMEKWGVTVESYINLLVTRGKDRGKVFKDLTIGNVIGANGERFQVFEIGEEKVILKGSGGEIYALY